MKDSERGSSDTSSSSSFDGSHPFDSQGCSSPRTTSEKERERERFNSVLATRLDSHDFFSRFPAFSLLHARLFLLSFRRTSIPVRQGIRNERARGRNSNQRASLPSGHGNGCRGEKVFPGFHGSKLSDVFFHSRKLAPFNVSPLHFRKL